MSLDATHEAPARQAPPVIHRPLLALWMWRRDLRPDDVTRDFGVSREWVRRYMLPFSSLDRRVPTPDVMRRIVAFTDGEVRPEDFYELRETSAVSDAEAHP